MESMLGHLTVFRAVWHDTLAVRLLLWKDVFLLPSKLFACDLKCHHSGLLGQTSEFLQRRKQSLIVACLHVSSHLSPRFAFCLPRGPRLVEGE